MNKHSIVLAVAVAAALAPAAQAQPIDSGPWIVRARALNLDPANDDQTGLDLSINSRTFGELDLTYFLGPNVAVELVLTIPQEHDVMSGGVKIGTLKHLPPTLSFQYHFTGMAWRPYLGAGLNYTHFSDVDLPPGVTIDNNSYGFALGAGFDVPLGGGWLINFDAKFVQIKTEVAVNGVNRGDFKIDPVLLSVGFGRRF